MPQFQLDTENAAGWDALPEVVQGFIEAMFFTNQCPASVLMDFTTGTCEARNFCEWPMPDEPQFIKAHWNHPEIQEAIREGQSDGEIPSDAGVADLDPESLLRLQTFVTGWVMVHKALVDAAVAQDGYDMDRLGNDLWYCSQGHGTGFWDREELDVDRDEKDPEGDTLGDRLASAARYNEFYIYFDPETQNDPCELTSREKMLDRINSVRHKAPTETMEADMADETIQRLNELCKEYADELRRGPSVEWAREHDFELTPRDDFDPETDDADDLDSYEDQLGAHDWIEANVYDTRYVVDSTGECIGASALVAGGGPTVWVDFEAMEVVGTWWSAPVRVPFIDGWDVGDALIENFSYLK